MDASRIEGRKRLGSEQDSTGTRRPVDRDFYPVHALLDKESGPTPAD
jgi:hypothetical protein